MDSMLPIFHSGVLIFNCVVLGMVVMKRGIGLPCLYSKGQIRQGNYGLFVVLR